MTLSRLDDVDNACAAYEKAIEMEEDMVSHLNYARARFLSLSLSPARSLTLAASVFLLRALSLSLVCDPSLDSM